MNIRQLLIAAAAGVVGATALTLLHHGAQRRRRDAPRMDVLGERALVKIVSALGGRPARGSTLHRQALIGDLLANGLFYGLLMSGGRPLLRGTTGGALAGLGAAYLPPRLGLGRAPHSRKRSTQAMTVGWYVAGGVAAALARRFLGAAVAGGGGGAARPSSSGAARTSRDEGAAAT